MEQLDNLTRELKEAYERIKALETRLSFANNQLLDMAAAVLKDLHDDAKVEYVYDTMVAQLGMPQYVEAMRRAELAPTQTEYQWIIQKLQEKE